MPGRNIEIAIDLKKFIPQSYKTKLNLSMHVVVLLKELHFQELHLSQHNATALLEIHASSSNCIFLDQ